MQSLTEDMFMVLRYAVPEEWTDAQVDQLIIRLHAPQTTPYRMPRGLSYVARCAHKGHLRATEATP